jgi:2,3-bisphosphoglycerate-independent phosphoglycerate mutase
MTKYLEDIDYPVAFPPIKIYTSVSKIISENNLLQLKIAEKYKAYHLTYFFNGFVNEPHPGEYWKILPPSDKSFKENPLLQSKLITELIINAVKENIYAFIAANYSAPDIIGHTGDINLAIQVVEGLNYEMKRIYNEIIDKEDWFMIITSDHGNIESMINLKTGEIQTTHDVNPVPCYIINKNFYIEKKSHERIIEEEKIKGSLVNIGPTILKLLNLEIPSDWEGRPLV